MLSDFDIFTHKSLHLCLVGDLKSHYNKWERFGLKTCFLHTDMNIK